MNVRHCLAAIAEAEESALWLEQHRPGDGGAFLDAFDVGVKGIAAEPQRHPRFESALAAGVERDIRRCVLRPFPHLLIFEIKSDFVVVLAVMHPSRDPTFWLNRLDGAD